MSRIKQNHSNTERSLVRGTKSQAAKNENKAAFLTEFLKEKNAPSMDFLTYSELMALSISIGKIDLVAEGVSENGDAAKAAFLQGNRKRTNYGND